MIEVIMLLIPKYIRHILLEVLLIKSYVLMMYSFSKTVLHYRGKKFIIKFIEAIFNKNEYSKKMIKMHFSKNVVMSGEDERIFRSSNKCWICNKFLAEGDNNVRNYDHVTGKYRDSAHWNCNINLMLIKKVPVIFHNFKGYDSHLIMQEIGKFDVKVSFIPNELEKCIAFTINNSLVFTNSMQFMNSSLDALVKNLLDNDFKHLSQEFSSNLSKSVKQKRIVSM